MPKTEPLVTIVTVTFNIINNGREFFLRQCIESVHAQSYKNIEHIIIDGASTDGTIDILNDYQKRNWIKYYSESDFGRYDAMNKGVLRANGKFISFLNSDDYYHNLNGVSISINALEKSGAVFSFASVKLSDEKNKTTIIQHPDISEVFYNIVPNHQTMFVKKDIMIKEGLYNSVYQCMADYDFTLKMCLKNYESIFINEVFVTYRLGGYSETALNNKTIKNEMTDIFYKNYNNLTFLSRRECSKISGTLYKNSITNIPTKLAIKLATRSNYFNLEKYINAIKSDSSSKITLTKKEIRIIKTIRKIKHAIIPEGSKLKKIFEKTIIYR